MSITKSKLNKVVEKINTDGLIHKISEFDAEAVSHLDAVPQNNAFSKVGQELRLDFVRTVRSHELGYLSQKKEIEDLSILKGNIENFIGMSQVPTGILGPLVVNGTDASGGYYVPLATTEGTLVASYSRGARACRESGAITSICVMEGVQRCPLFKFKDLIELGEFVVWIMQQKDQFRAIVEDNSNYAKLTDLEFNIDGNQIILDMEYTTGDASGQNMVTLATKAVCEYIIANTPVQPEMWFIESNYSGDKKATTNSFTSVRGKRVTAEIVLKRDIVKRVLKTTPEMMFNYWQISFMGAVKCGAIGAQGHFANGLTALFIACGQDAACVSEASVGLTRMEVNGDGDLYCTVTLPNLIVGTVGGGTSLPTQRECLEIMDCYGAGKAKKLAEISAALCLAGEISIIAALSAGQFAAAHEKHGRK